MDTPVSNMDQFNNLVQLIIGVLNAAGPLIAAIAALLAFIQSSIAKKKITELHTKLRSLNVVKKDGN